MTNVVITAAARTAVGVLRNGPQGRPADRARPHHGRGGDGALGHRGREAFAAQALAVLIELGIDDEDPRVNPNGGAIALGHPIGATGALITAKALDEMERRGHELGLVTLCIGGGQGIALLLGRDD